MGTVWVKELTGGLDTRRMAETTPGGVLIKATDGHISRGGEFEKRAAFVSEYSLPAGTIGLAYTSTGLLVFGHQAAPAMPTGVSYQRLQHPDGATALARVLSFDLYAGKIYAVGEFADGSISHFYDGARVTDWFDGRARAAFQVTGGSVTPAVAAVGSFDVTGGTLGGGNQITSVKVDGIDVLTGPIAHTGSNASTATAIASAINSLASSPDYTAVAVGTKVTITASLTGVAANGKVVAVVVGGTSTVGSIVNMAGGAAAITSRLTALTVNGISAISGPINWATSNSVTAAAIASAINSFVSVPEYTATAVGDVVNIVADAPGTTPNGYAVAMTVADGFAVTPAAGLVLANGATSAGTFEPGTFARTIGSKVYSVSDSRLHFSGIQAPTKWTTATTGAGFIDMSSESSGAEQLVAVANYQGFVAVFAGRVVLIWYVDPDPKLNKKAQVLRNTGTESPGSVTEFGDNDLFYLDESGLRSLRARDSSNSASTTDIGVPVDSLIVEKLAALTAEQRDNIVGLINPVDGRFWLCFPDEVFVFSFFANAKVSAWSSYLPQLTSGGVTTTFQIEKAVVFGRRVYLRSGNTIYAHGGINTKTYDETVAKAWLPYFDAGKPADKKQWQGLDAAVSGQWDVYAGMQLGKDTLSVQEQISTIFETTFNRDRIPFSGDCTHVSPRFESRGVGPAVLSSVLLHYEGGEDEG